MTQPPLPNPASLFPGLGYFGATALDCIEMAWSSPVRGIRLTIPADGGQNVLNLMRLELLGPQGPLSWAGDVVAVAQSSVYQNDPGLGPQQLLQGRSIHTQPEPEPWWQATFAEDVPLRRLRLFNRGDRWGIRARHLRIALLIDGRWQTVHDPRGAQHALAVLQDCLACAGPVRVESSLPDLRQCLRAAIAERLRTLQLLPAGVPWRSVLTLVDIWGDSAPDEDDLTLLAAWMSQTSGLYPLLPLAGRLKTPAAVLALQSRLQEIAVAQGLGHFVITRHGIQRSYLLTHREAFLDGAQTLIARLEALDYQAVLAYGTLLGAVRDGALIPHDDDLDLLMPCRAGDQAGVAAEMTRLAERLRGFGYQVEQLLPQSLNMHVRDTALGVELDLFPCWQDATGRLHLHMEKMAIRPIDASLLLPPGQVRLHDRAMPAPADPQGFLLERYGAGWTVPNQFFEWPWPLSAPGGARTTDSH